MGCSNLEPLNTSKFALALNDVEQQAILQLETNSKRAQWVRAAVLRAHDGLVSTASLVMDVKSCETGHKAMTLSGFAGLVAGACSMAIGEFVCLLCYCLPSACLSLSGPTLSPTQG